MEITVKFDELYAGDDGRVSDVVINAIAAQLAESFTPEVKERIKRQLNLSIEADVAGILAEELAKVLDGEFDKVDRYGHRAGKTTLRQVIAAELQDAVAQLAKTDRHHARSEGASPLSKMVQATVSELVGAEVKAYLAEIRHQTATELAELLRVAVEKVR